MTLETDRLRLRRLTFDDSDFIVQLLNEPSFLQYIGDKGVRDRDGAQRYLREGPLASYEKFGFGLYRVADKADDAPMGICGLLKRDTLHDVDVGFAFLPRYWRQGYAIEAAKAVLEEGRERFALTRIVAITSPDNAASIALLDKLGFAFEGMRRLTPEAPEVRVFARET